MRKVKLIALGVFAVFVIIIVLIVNSQSFQRGLVDFKSDIGGGLNRTINVYTADGDLIATYTGKIDIDSEHDGAVKFDYNGKRYIYYNCFVETIADIN
jgi:hypothetical protein